MSRIRRLLISALAVFGLLVALGSSGAALASPRGSAAMAMMPDAGCEHSPAMPASHDMQPCGTLCCAVLPSLARVMALSPVPPMPAAAPLITLSGIDPGLDPPPPRAA
jgi:hypothetical protein